MAAEADVIVIGGGPSGAAAAYHLASQGHSVVVCERKKFPRHKTCGDGLTPRAVRALEDMGLAESLAGAHRVGGLRLCTATRAVELPFPVRDGWPRNGLVIRRRELDQLVLDNAEAAGATVRYETEAMAPIIERGVACGVRVRTPHGDQELRGRWIVGADGGTGRMARLLGRVRDRGHPLAIGLRQYVRCPQPPTGWLDIHLDLRPNGRMLWGYGWAFPLADGTVNVGTGGLARELPGPARPIQDQFVARLTQDWGTDDGAGSLDGRATGGRLPLADCVWPLHGPGYVLVGDAAGRINPATGEGIAYGYETGRLAARHISAALRRSGARSLPGYTEEVRDTYAAYNRLARGVLRFVVGNPMIRCWAMATVLVSDRAREVAATVLTNPTSSGGGADERVFRGMKRVAEMLA